MITLGSGILPSGSSRPHSASFGGEYNGDRGSRPPARWSCRRSRRWNRQGWRWGSASAVREGNARESARDRDCPRPEVRVRKELGALPVHARTSRSEEHTSELQLRENLVCRLLLEKKKKKQRAPLPGKQNTRRPRVWGEG